MTSNNTQPTAPNTPEEPVRVNHTTRNIVIAVVVVVAIVLAIVFGMRAVNTVSYTHLTLPTTPYV